MPAGGAGAGAAGARGISSDCGAATLALGEHHLLDAPFVLVAREPCATGAAIREMCGDGFNPVVGRASMLGMVTDPAMLKRLVAARKEKTAFRKT